MAGPQFAVAATIRPVMWSYYHDPLTTRRLSITASSSLELLGLTVANSALCTAIALK